MQCFVQDAKPLALKLINRCLGLRCTDLKFGYPDLHQPKNNTVSFNLAVLKYLIASMAAQLLDL
jgi:hypothetical protein